MGKVASAYGGSNPGDFSRGRGGAWIHFHESGDTAKCLRLPWITLPLATYKDLRLDLDGDTGHARNR